MPTRQGCGNVHSHKRNMCDNTGVSGRNFPPVSFSPGKEWAGPFFPREKTDWGKKWPLHWYPHLAIDSGVTGSIITEGTLLCHWARHFIYPLLIVVLVQPMKIGKHPDMSESCWLGHKASIQTNKTPIWSLETMKKKNLAKSNPVPTIPMEAYKWLVHGHG